MKGGLMKKLGLKGKVKPGEMIAKMNKMKGMPAKAMKASKKVVSKGKKIIKKII